MYSLLRDGKETMKYGDLQCYLEMCLIVAYFSFDLRLFCRETEKETDMTQYAFADMP